MPPRIDGPIDLAAPPEPTGVDAWQWQLPSGKDVVAQHNADTLVETIRMGGRVMSRSSPGGSPDGHAFTAYDAVPSSGKDTGAPFRQAGEARIFVKWIDARSTFELTFNGAPVELTAKPPPRPTRMSLGPKPQRPIEPMETPTQWGRIIAIVVALGIAVAIPLVIVPYVRGLLQTHVDDAVKTLEHDSPNKAVRVSFPDDFTPKRGHDGVLVVVKRDDPNAHVIAAWRGRGTDAQPMASRTAAWLAGELGAPKAPYTETEHHDNAPCGKAEKPGTESIGELAMVGSTLRVWSCTFVYEGHVYTFAYSARPGDPQLETRLKNLAGRTWLRAHIPCNKGGPCSNDILVY